MTRQRIFSIMVIFQVLLVSFSLSASVSAFNENIIPTKLYLSTGDSNSTNVAVLSLDNNISINFQSARSGDKNYYESYIVNSIDDFKDYFKVYRSNIKLPVEFKDEKAGGTEGNEIVHKGVIRIQDKYNTSYNPTYYYYNQWIWMKEPINESSLDNDGYFEFYFLSESTNGSFMVCFGDYDYKRYYSNGEKGQSLGINFGITTGLNNNNENSSFFCSTSWTDSLIPINAVQYVPETWYHVQLGFSFNNSWYVKINNQTVYSSSNWTISTQLKKFDFVGMYTQTSYKASGHASHVFYIDALGLSYNLTKHNEFSDIDFNLEYEDYVDRYSKNNLNDHDVNASLVVYFKFDLGEYINRTSRFTLKITGHFTQAVNFSQLLAYNRQDSYYEVIDDEFKPYITKKETSFEFTESIPETLNKTYYTDDQGRFNVKVEAQSNNKFDLNLYSIYVVFNIGFNASDFSYLIIIIIAAVLLLVIFQISRREKLVRGVSSRRGKKGRRARAV
ncbi:MAG: hypothetical protein ACTSVI_12395 [Promethearchaeota archaeon]